MIKINLGCGSRHLPSPWVNCDNKHFARPDRLFDFGKDEWPFPDGSADEINASHCLEHSRGLNHVMQEAYRVLVPGSAFRIEVPHPRSDWFIGDPTHVLPITQAGLQLYSKAWCDRCQADGSANTPLALQLGVDFQMLTTELVINRYWFPKLVNEDMSVVDQDKFDYCVATYNNVIDFMKFVLVRV